MTTDPANIYLNDVILPALDKVMGLESNSAREFVLTRLARRLERYGKEANIDPFAFCDGVMRIPSPGELPDER